MKKIKAMIVSVGGTPAPIIHSLNHSKPEFVCFFASEETKRMIMDEIVPKLEFQLSNFDWIVTPTAESLSVCYGELRKKLPDILIKWEVDPKDVCVDYTGGTKTMSVALSLATIEYSCCYSYVGGDERSKGGVGVVVNGKERMQFLDNPWDEIALKEKREASILFNKARYAAAAQVLEKCVSMVSEEQQSYFKALSGMMTGYDLWDRFRHRDAKERLYRSRDVLSAFAHASGKAEDIALTNQIFANIGFLEKILSTSKPSIFYCYDLLGNAKRRADLEHKFDDAIARLYRGIEVLAQVELKTKFEIETSNVKEIDLPESLREEYMNMYKDKHDLRIKVPLFASYRLLRELGNELAGRYFASYDKEIRPILDVRNNSILAHGFNPVDEGTFQKVWSSIIKFSGIGDDDLPTFPSLKI